MMLQCCFMVISHHMTIVTWHSYAVSWSVKSLDEDCICSIMLLAVLCFKVRLHIITDCSMMLLCCLRALESLHQDSRIMRIITMNIATWHYCAVSASWQSLHQACNMMLLCCYRVNCYDILTPQTPFGGFKQSGHGRELWVWYFYLLFCWLLNVPQNPFVS